MGKHKGNKYLIRIAKQIAELERSISLGKNVQENTSKIESICAHLSPEEMMEIDECILTHKI